MKLRAHLVLLVLAIVVPLLAFSAIMGYVFWRQQRAEIDQRQLERVRALAIALDREMEGHIRAVEVLATARSLQAGNLAAFHEHALRVRVEQASWDAIILTDRTGAQLVNTHRPFGAPLPMSGISAELITKVISSGRPAVSPLVKGAVTGRYATAIVVPVRRDGGIVGVLIAGIEPRVWLELFARYPLAPGATITVLDQHGVITARTLNPEQSLGRRPSATLAEHASRATEGTFRNPGGLEGQVFYSAFTRSKVAGWTVASGVPSAVVESELRASVFAFALGGGVTIVLAVSLALVFGRRIALPVRGLADSVRRFGAGEPPAAAMPHAVAEVQEVARAFEDAAAQLAAREAALRESRAQAEEANRTKDEFLAVLSHELRTPINAVYGWARMLRDGKLPPETVERALQIIERNAAAQVRLIEDLLDISRIVSGKMRLEVADVDLAKAIDGALDAVRHAAQVKDIQLESAIDADAGPVAGDAARLQQVVWNLLSNAIKFTPSGGHVRVRLTRVDRRRVEVVVTDTGIGIAPALAPYIFDRFRQGDSTSTRAHAGLGLGLALVKHIVELHGGTVRADSPGEGHGATFTVSLPAS